MDQIINLQKTVVNKDNIDRLVDKEIKFFRQDEVISNQNTIEDLFKMYDELYLLIPAEGENNSHEYLVKRSSLIYNLGRETTNLQPLLDEIGDLREQLLEANNRIFDLENQLNGN
jgi:hypothetical protein